jgi:hypothetical protein
MTRSLITYFRRHHIALLALFVAIGGTSYAAVKLPSNSVATKQIKNGQVKGADLAKNSVNSQKVKDLSLKASDFAPGQLPTGPVGKAGPAGPQGKPGVAGAPATKLFVVSDESGNILASRGVVSQAQVIQKIGTYAVPFDRDIRNCARVATIGDGAAFISTEVASPTVVKVVTTGASNPGTGEAHSFSLAVFC